MQAPIQMDVTFSSGPFKLNGTLHRPKQTGKPALVIGCHGLLSNRHSAKQIDLADACNAFGLAYFRFDHRGCGQSQGRFADGLDFSGRCQDLVAAIDYLKSTDPFAAGVGLFGSSYGAAVAMAVAADLNLAPVVTLAAPVSSDIIAAGAVQGQLADTLADEPGAVERISFDIRDRLDKLHHILVFHGQADDTVPIKSADIIFEKASNPKKMTVFANGDHRISNPEHQATLTRQASRWFRTHLSAV